MKVKFENIPCHNAVHSGSCPHTCLHWGGQPFPAHVSHLPHYDPLHMSIDVWHFLIEDMYNDVMPHPKVGTLVLHIFRAYI